MIKRVAGRLIQEKKRKIEEAQEKGEVHQGKDLLSLMCESIVSFVTRLEPGLTAYHQ